MAKSRAHVVQCDVPVPPPDPRPFVPSITLPGNRETAFLALHNRVSGFLMHWVENQPVPHPKDRQWCAGCKLGQTPRWTGFLGVVSLLTMNRFILSLPKAAFRESGHFKDKSDAHHLAGVVFTGWRFGHTRSKNNPAVIEVLDYPYPVPKMNAFPLHAALARAWRMENLECIEEMSNPDDEQIKLATQFVSFAQVRAEHNGTKKKEQKS